MSGRRPEDVPLFATNAPAGGLVEPVEIVRTQGFSTKTRPPAQWVNWMFYWIGQWIDFLRGASLSNWQRYDASAGTANLIQGDADITTVEALSSAAPIYPAYRYLAVASADAHLYTSRDGRSFKQLTPHPTVGFGNPQFVLWTGTRWLCATDQPALWWSWPSQTTNPSGSSLDNDTTAWNAVTLPGGVTTPLWIASDGTGKVAAVTATNVLYSSTNGTSFVNAVLSAAPVGAFTSLVWTGHAWVAVTDHGEVYRTADGSTTWTLEGTTWESPHSWLIATDGAGTVVGYVTGDTGIIKLRISTDDGTTWAQVTPPYGIQRLKFVNGVWVYLGTGPVPLAAINDPTTTNWLRLPFGGVIEGEGINLRDVIAGVHEVVGLGSQPHTIVSKCAEDVAPGPWTPGAAPARLYDAAYLRGTLVDGSVPQAGETIRYNPTSTQFDMWGRTVNTAADYVCTGGERTVAVTDTTLARTITMPPSPIDGDRFAVKDESNGAGTHAITIQPAAGTVEGGASIQITTNRGAKTFYARGGNWWLESQL